jgi:hypothetical protein
MDIRAIKDILFPILATNFSATIAHSFLLPPWDRPEIAAFPRFQKYYRLFVYVVGYVAINMRSTTFKSISTQTTGGVNESINNGTKVDQPTGKV